MLQNLKNIEQIQYLQCCKESHQNQPLSIICADPQCQSRSLLCIYCEQQNHQDHKTLPLKLYLKKLMTTIHQQLLSSETNKTVSDSLNNKEVYEDQNNEQEVNRSILTYSMAANKFRQNFNNEVESFRCYINQLIDQIKTCGYHYVNELDIRIKEISQITKQIQKIIRQSQQFNDLDDPQSVILIKKQTRQIQSVLKYGIIDENGQIPIGQQLQDVISDCQQRSQMVKNCFQKSISYLTSNQFKIIQQNLLREIQGYSIHSSVTWSSTLKGLSMKITGNLIEKTALIGADQRFALIDQSLKPSSNKNKSFFWTLRIAKLTGWIGIGICMKNKIISSKYTFSYQSLGHGSYMLSSNGYSWSSTVQTFNSAHHHNLSFATGDYITLQFDPKQSKLKFQITGKTYTKSKSKKMKSKPQLKTATKTFSLDISKDIGTDEYYPCVNLCSVGDSVQIAND